MTDDTTREEIDADRCIALTASGERCSRPARDGVFCYQHDEEDETVLDAITADGGESDLAGELASLTAQDEEPSEENGDGEQAEVEADESEDASAEEGAESSEEETATDEEAESTEEEGVAADEEAETETSVGGDDASTDLGTIRGRVEENASELVGRPFDGVASIRAEDDGWIAVVELVERPAVPDTQDIIGRYELEIDDGGNITGYDRLERYRRGDTKAFE